MSVNVEIKSGLLYNIKEVPYGDNRKYLTFTVGTRRDYKEKNRYRLNYRKCRVYSEYIIDYIKGRIKDQKPGFKMGFYLEGESYSDTWTKKDGELVYDDYFKVNHVKFLGFVLDEFSSKADDLDAEVDW